MGLNKVYCMDNLELLKQLPDNSIDLIYSDILYATGGDFKDYQDIPYVKEDVFAFYDGRIKEMYRVLKPTGTLALQMDFRITHWVRIMCDEHFGYKNCINVIQWAYSSGGSSKKKLSQKNDEIIIYAKDKNKQKFNYHTEVSYNRDFKPYKFKGVEEYQDDFGRWYTMVGMKCIWTDIPMVGRSSSERIGYMTQKPLKLMNRIRDLYTDENDVIADFFCGSGSMIESAKLGDRQYIGCDINQRAVDITNERLNI
ncbi:site-specific DNA-methyltransferase [Terrisporobacter mayombei]|nr:site-specific DNA-methyltransferase [Terrisporobacter mayombei]